MKAGFDADKDFGRVIFSGSHDSNAVAVQNRKVDAVAIADRILDAAIAKGLAKREDLVVVWKSDPIPESPTVWRKDLDPAPEEARPGRLPGGRRTSRGPTRAS